MASLRVPLCGPCQFRKLEKVATEWCQECDDTFCSICSEYHGSRKSNKGHTVISIEHYKTLPPFILQLSQHCTKHEQKFTNYCTSHEETCCPRCVVDGHEKCKGLKVLSDIIMNAKSSTVVENAEKSLLDLHNNVKKALDNMKQNMETLDSERKTIMQAIQNVRDTINKHLDDLQRDILLNLDDLHNPSKKKLQDLIKELEKKMITIDKMEGELNSIKIYASDLQTFLGTKELYTRIHQEQIEIERYFDEGKFENIEIVFKINENIERLSTQIESFGSIKTATYQPTYSLDSWEKRQAQIDINKTWSSFDEISFERLQNFRIPEQIEDDSFRSCLVLWDENYVFSNYDKHCLIFLDVKGSFLYDISLSSYSACDMVQINDTLLAVTSGIKKSISIVNMKSKTIEKNIRIQGRGCYGITKTGKYLIFAVWGFQKLDLQDYNVTDFHNKAITSEVYVTSSPDHIYAALWSPNELICLDNAGVVVWRTELAHGRLSRGLTLDNRGFIYVSCQRSGNVIIVSSDGQKQRSLTDVKDIRGICYDKRRNYMVTTTNLFADGCIQIFELKG